MPRFVVQHHVLGESEEHWDLMFEAGDVLWTWSLPCPPDAPDSAPEAAPPAVEAPPAGRDGADGAADQARLPAVAWQLADHRLLYLEYEGEIEGGRGRVAIHDRGDFQWVGPAPDAPLHTISRLEFRLDGLKAQGTFRLSRIPHEGKDLWRLSRMKGPA